MTATLDRPDVVDTEATRQVLTAAAGGVDLSTLVEGQHLSGGEYFIYAAGATEVELDVLTGEYQILRVRTQACLSLGSMGLF